MPPRHLFPNLQQQQQQARFQLRKAMAGMGGKRSPGDPAEPNLDYSSKLLHLAWHPEANVIACAASNSLYMYCA
jgi:serine/threonine-protein phosphatase 2A regulatory subunit B